MSTTEIASTARSFLRDFPKYFEMEAGPLNVLTIRLPHPLVSPASVQVYVNDPDAGSTALTKKWLLDERNGLLKLTDESLLDKRVTVAAYHYTWFTDADLAMHASQAAEEVAYSSGGDPDNISGIYTEVTAMGAVVRALWSLALEFSFDIDVSTPEGMFIPARQRFAQVIQMMQYWEGEYNTRAAALNIGLGALEVFRLRRVAYLTNRYVPVYQEREIDDPRPPHRLYPPIPDGSLPELASGGLTGLLYEEPSTPDDEVESADTLFLGP
jgi:hypothetical protein